MADKNCNALYQPDGTTPNHPPQTVLNVEHKFALDPDSVPEPKATTWQALGALYAFVPYFVPAMAGWNLVQEDDVDPIFLCQAATAEHSPK